MWTNNKKITISAIITGVLSTVIISSLIASNNSNKASVANEDVKDFQASRLVSDCFKNKKKYLTFSSRNDLGGLIADFKFKTDNNQFFSEYLTELNDVYEGYPSGYQAKAKIEEVNARYPEQASEFMNYVRKHHTPSR
jgi:hypothetical protein